MWLKTSAAHAELSWGPALHAERVELQRFVQDLMCFPGEDRDLAGACPSVAVCSWRLHKLGHGAGLWSLQRAAQGQRCELQWRGAPGSRAFLPGLSPQGQDTLRTLRVDRRRAWSPPLNPGVSQAVLEHSPSPGSCHPPWDLPFILSSGSASKPMAFFLHLFKALLQCCF